MFEKPKSLPPHKEDDHGILLKPRVSPINVSPYRYPALQKDVIEKNCVGHATIWGGKAVI